MCIDVCIGIDLVDRDTLSGLEKMCVLDIFSGF